MLTGAVDQSSFSRAVVDISLGMDISPEAIKDAAESLSLRLGAEVAPELVSEMAQSVRQAFEDQARAVVESTGLDPDAVFSWAQADRPESLRAAIRNHGLKRSTAGYKALADAYMDNLDELDPDALVNAEDGPGLRVYRGKDGRVMADTPFGTMTWKAARMAGIIKTSKATR